MVVTGERCKRCFDVGSLSRPVTDSQVQRGSWQSLEATAAYSYGSLCLVLKDLLIFLRAHLCSYLQRSGEDPGSPEAGITGSCDPLPVKGPRRST